MNPGVAYLSLSLLTHGSLQTVGWRPPSAPRHADLSSVITQSVLHLSKRHRVEERVPTRGRVLERWTCPSFMAWSWKGHPITFACNLLIRDKSLGPFHMPGEGITQGHESLEPGWKALPPQSQLSNFYELCLLLRLLLHPHGWTNLHPWGFLILPP